MRALQDFPAGDQPDLGEKFGTDVDSFVAGDTRVGEFPGNFWYDQSLLNWNFIKIFDISLNKISTI